MEHLWNMMGRNKECWHLAMDMTPSLRMKNRFVAHDFLVSGCIATETKILFIVIWVKIQTLFQILAHNVFLKICFVLFRQS